MANLRLGLCALSTLALIAGCGAEGGDGTADGPDGGNDEPATADLVETTGCDGAKLLAAPDDTSQRGPWAVGARTVQIGGHTVEIWYPAVPGSDEGKAAKEYDIRDFLPMPDRQKFTDDRNATQKCECSEGLPIDDVHGPYPVVFYIHGTSAFRTASLPHMTHWASRGFVVVAEDIPGLWMLDWLANSSGGACQGTGAASDYIQLLPIVANDIDVMTAALASAEGDLSFLSGRTDTTRIGVTGHSFGGVAATLSVATPAARVLVPLNGWGPALAAPGIESVVGITSIHDAVALYDSAAGAFPFPLRNSYGSWAVPPGGSKRLVAVTDAGHLMPTDLCSLRNQYGETMLDIGRSLQLCGLGSIAGLYDCKPDHIPVEKQTEIVRYASAAALEETLHCADRSSAWAAMQERYGEVGDSVLN